MPALYPERGEVMKEPITNIDRVIFWQTISNGHARRVFDMACLNGADDEAKLIAVLVAFREDAEQWQRRALELIENAPTTRYFAR